MYFYVDESGQTGLNLFDANQPFLYYGVLSSDFNLDEVLAPFVHKMRDALGVERLHAAELGNGRLLKIADDLIHIHEKYKLSFDLYRITKRDHAVISFFDQVFDQGNNLAVPWHFYWTPLRYVLLLNVNFLFDEKILKIAWDARISRNKKNTEIKLVEVCTALLHRVFLLPDQRTRDVLTDAFNWAIKNPDKIHYGAMSENSRLQISPNLIGFQFVMHGIAERLKTTKKEATKVIVDRQSQFNKAQKWISDFYRNNRDLDEYMEFGPGMPKMSLKYIPSVEIECTAGSESFGLEMVDIYTWLYKRNMEGRQLAIELHPLLDAQKDGVFAEVSLPAIAERWGKWFTGLQESTLD